MKHWCSTTNLDFKPCAHAQSNFLHIKYAEKTN